MIDLKAIFENGGGVTIKYIEDKKIVYAKYYNDMENAGIDIYLFVNEGIDHWFENEKELYNFEVTKTGIRNGAFKVYNLKELFNAIDNKDFDSAWHNINSLVEELKVRLS